MTSPNPTAPIELSLRENGQLQNAIRREIYETEKTRSILKSPDNQQLLTDAIVSLREIESRLRLSENALRIKNAE